MSFILKIATSPDFVELVKDTKKDAKDVRDSTKEQYEPRDSSTAPGGRRRQ